MVKETNKDIAARIKDIRASLKMKSKDLAKRLGISASSLSEIEKGKYYPNFEFISKIGRLFKVNLYYLVYGEGKMFLESDRSSYLLDLEKLADNNPDIKRFLEYFLKSAIIRYYLLKEFNTKITVEKDLIEKELKEKK